MLKTKEKLAAFLIAVFMALGLAGCGVNITSIGLPASETIAKGETLQLNLNYGTENEAEAEAIEKAAAKLTIEWTSADESVATVDENGLVTAVNAGETDITASVKDGNLQSVCHVTVVIPMTSLEVKDTLSLVINGTDSASIEAKATPEDATNVEFTYTSSDETVATVDENGNVKAVANGECVIATTAVANNTATPESATSEAATSETSMGSIPVVFEGETKVVVTTAPATIAFDSSEGILTVGNTYTLQAYVEPADVSDENSGLTWTSSDESVATVDESGNVSANSAGNATITATTTNGKSAEYQLTVQNVKCSYCGQSGHTSSNCPVKAADQKAAQQRAAEQAAAAAAQQQQAAQSSGGSTASGGGSAPAPAPDPAPAPAPDPGPSGGESSGGGYPDDYYEQGQGGSLGGTVITGGGNGDGAGEAPPL